MQKIYTNIGLMATPTEGKHLVNKEYVDAAVNRKLKDPVTAVATQDLNSVYDNTAKTLTQSAGAVYAVDGVTLAVGDRVLVAGQTDATQNGIYVVTTLGAAETSEDAGDAVLGVLTRSDDFDESAKIAPNVIIPVMQGTQNGDTNWQLINDAAVTLDTTTMSFAKFNGSEGANVFTATITGDGVAKEFPVTHGLNSEAVVVSVVDAATKEQCMFGVTITSPNVITLKSDVVLENTGSFIVTVIG